MESVDHTCQMRYCVNCNADACHPHDWWEDGPEHWEVILYCGNCEIFHQGRYHQDEVEEFDIWLDDCADLIQREADKLTKENIRGEIKRLRVMLEKDIIMPDDFTP